MSNFIPLKIQNLQGEIYQLVDKETEMPIYQGTWLDCSHKLRNILSEEFKALLYSCLPPN